MQRTFDWSNLSRLIKSLSFGLVLVCIGVYVMSFRARSRFIRLARDVYVITDAGLHAGLPLVWGFWFGMLDVPSYCWQQCRSGVGYAYHRLFGERTHVPARLDGVYWRMVAGDLPTMHRYFTGERWLPIHLPLLALVGVGCVFLLNTLAMRGTNGVVLWLVLLGSQVVVMALAIVLFTLLAHAQTLMEERYQAYEAWYDRIGQDSRVIYMRDLLLRVNRWNRIERYQALRWSCSTDPSKQELAQASHNYFHAVMALGIMLEASWEHELPNTGMMQITDAVDHYDAFVMPHIRNLAASEQELARLYLQVYPPQPPWLLRPFYRFRDWWLEVRRTLELKAHQGIMQLT
jgi:hypothetical protein